MGRTSWARDACKAGAYAGAFSACLIAWASVPAASSRASEGPDPALLKRIRTAEARIAWILRAAGDDVREFDRRLDAGARGGPDAGVARSALRSVPYRRLHAGRALEERDSEALMALYARLSGSPGERLRARVAEIELNPEAFLAELLARATGAEADSLRAVGAAIEAEIAAAADELAAREEAPAESGRGLRRRGRPGVSNLGGEEYREGRWSLTFDDGPSPQYTTLVLDALARNGLRASFMWLARNAPSAPSAIDRARQMGMALCNHSFTHPNLTQLGQAQLNHEVRDAGSVLFSWFTTPLRAYRCPYGACGYDGSAPRRAIVGAGLVQVGWNVDSLDWRDANPQSIYARVKKQMEIQRRGIILFHDVHPQSPQAAELVMRDIAAGQRAGTMRSLTVHQAIDELNSPGGMR